MREASYNCWHFGWNENIALLLLHHNAYANWGKTVLCLSFDVVAMTIRVTSNCLLGSWALSNEIRANLKVSIETQLNFDHNTNRLASIWTITGRNPAMQRRQTSFSFLNSMAYRLFFMETAFGFSRTNGSMSKSRFDRIGWGTETGHTNPISCM